MIPEIGDSKIVAASATARWQVIAEASMGQQAVQKAKELKPNVVLLDIALPKLNGIEAAPRIRQLYPSSK